MPGEDKGNTCMAGEAAGCGRVGVGETKEDSTHVVVGVDVIHRFMVEAV